MVGRHQKLKKIKVSYEGFLRRRKFAAGVKFVKAAATGVSPRAREKLKKRTVPDHAPTLPSMSR